MRLSKLLPALLIPACFVAACIPRRPRPGVVGQGPSAGADGPGPIHSVSEVQPPAPTAVSEPVPGFMRGINLGNALEAPREGAWGVTLSPEYFEMAKAKGLDHVRLPVRFSAHAPSTPPYKIDEAIFKRVDWAIEQAAKNGLSVIIDLHHYQELMKKPAENADELVSLWQQIAERFKARPASVAFELINEPNGELKSEFLNPITKRALAAVRASNPTRIVFVNSYFWAAADRLKELELPEDLNLVPSFHMYQPILFTHQRMGWMGPEYQTPGIVFPGPPATPVTPVEAAQKTDWANAWLTGYNTQPITENPNGPKAVFDYFKIVEDYITATHRRVYMGEFGVANSADPTSRENWLRLVRQEAERRHIGWAVWDDGAGFRAMNVKRGDWIAPVEAGLFH
jgi:endoglucanase